MRHIFCLCTLMTSINAAEQNPHLELERQSTASPPSSACSFDYKNQNIAFIPKEAFTEDDRNLHIDCHGSKIGELVSMDTLELFKQKWHIPRLLSDHQKNQLSPVSITLNLTNTPLTSLPEWFNTQASVTFYMEPDRPVTVSSTYQYPKLCDGWTNSILNYTANYDLKALSYDSFMSAKQLFLEIYDGFKIPPAPKRIWGEEDHADRQEFLELSNVFFLTSRMILESKPVRVTFVSQSGLPKNYQIVMDFETHALSSKQGSRIDVLSFRPEPEDNQTLKNLQHRLERLVSTLEC